MYIRIRPRAVAAFVRVLGPSLVVRRSDWSRKHRTGSPEVLGPSLVVRRSEAFASTGGCEVHVILAEPDTGRSHTTAGRMADHRE